MEGAGWGRRGLEGWLGAQTPPVLQKEQAEEFEAQQRKGVKRSESVEKAQVRNWDPEPLEKGEGCLGSVLPRGFTGLFVLPGQEAATLIAQRAVNPRDIFKQREKAGPGDMGVPAQPGTTWGHREGAGGGSQSPLGPSALPNSDIVRPQLELTTGN